MKMGLTNTVAVLTNDLANPLQMKIIRSIEESAMEAGFFVNICGGSKNLDRYVTNLISRRIDGVFLAGDPYAITGEYMNRLLSKNISVILGTVNGSPIRGCAESAWISTRAWKPSCNFSDRWGTAGSLISAPLTTGSWAITACSLSAVI